MPISPLSPGSIRPFTPPALADLAPASGSTPRGSAGGSVFHEALGQAISQVQSAEATSQASLERFLNGEGEEIHKVALDAQRASLQFEFFLQMRNKVVQAYQEIMRQQL